MNIEVIFYIGSNVCIPSEKGMAKCKDVCMNAF